MNLFDLKTFINVILVIILASVLFVIPFKMVNPSADKRYWYHRKENWWILAGFVIALVAVSNPFVLMYIVNTNIVELLKQSSDVQEESIDYLSVLASMGDFLGGTTVGLLSLASIIFVTAAIFMQKEELELQRKEITATRQEYEITNATMKKQQFDSTFFNMINLHQRILNDIEIGKNIGRVALEKVIEDIRDTYENKIVSSYIDELKSMLIIGNYKIIGNILFEKRAISYGESSYMNCNRELKELNSLREQVDVPLEYINKREMEVQELKKERREEKRIEFLKRADNDSHYLKRVVSQLDIDECIKQYKENEYFIKVNSDINLAPLIELKKKAFDTVYSKNEPQIGHYFRNLYHIMKLINELAIYNDKNQNDNEKNKYRAILRAQLSSKELLLIFYNIAYSTKGEGFKELLTGTNFFDDHINNEKLIWKNDLSEIKRINEGTGSSS